VGETKIEWTEVTWNPLVGCSRVSEGCRNCYAEQKAYHNGACGIRQYKGLTQKVGNEIRWTGEVAFVESALEKPLHWKKPRRIFVNSMSDLFHEKAEDIWIEQVFEVMAKTPQHTFQILTKRPERMLEWVTRPRPVPLPNVWLGISAENQATAEARVPLLTQTPAAVRWVSYEPALGPVDFSAWRSSLDWIVVGGESGRGARLFHLAWAHQTIAQGRAAETAVFVKQLGKRPVANGSPFPLNHLKGGDIKEWPKELRVREYPAPWRRGD
jgi:protein gp37